jgi:LysM repeat protein
LSKIAPRHGISTAALIKANPQIKNHDLIFPGQQINIPGKATGGMIIPKRMAGGGPAYPVRRMAGGSMVKGYPLGGLIPYSSVGGPFPSLGSDTIPAMLTPGEFVIRRPAVREIGVDKLENLNRNASMGGDVYNYSVSVNVKSESDADRIARTVIDQIKRIDSQRIRGNTY